ncbi:TauD/TfdA dioxygenase family protein [Actinomadura parmotrematis]|uniref:TauD/TfdA family dioxygenase n=1 Tax=Actinomadura parmotrematis TaxID=2864039 RepID=A0ABS7G438_9ACTN|nr:TauD/TfdA family dioxygenase [Actinomadura parmotrematis]MBW8487488.1 TauD/TfdA family dioxygenase [Actinomadura parmotrematis]
MTVTAATTPTAPPAYRVRRAGPLFGAEITGLDLAAPVDEATADALRREFVAHKVLVFRDQHLEPEQHVAAVRIFGEPFDHPTAKRAAADGDLRFVYPYDVRSAGKAALWHVGGVWRTPPFSIESLTYQAVPELGGHTLWADLQAAYDGLSEPVRALLESVSAVYEADPVNYAQGSAKVPTGKTIEHPVVFTHPDTGRKGLFLSTGATDLTGVTSAEAKVLLPFLLQHAASPDYTIRFSWRPGDFVLWDNRATWHYAIDDYADGPRRYRKVIATREHLAAPAA